MLPHVPNALGSRNDRSPMQTVSTIEASEDSTGLTQLRARRSQAFARGEAKARHREISADAYLFLYKELVGLAGDRTYCWPSLEYLAVTLNTSEGTLKRWMKELERADLIQRKPRPGGQTSLTYITVYLEPDPHIESRPYLDDHSNDEVDVQPLTSNLTPDDLLAHVEQVAPSPPQGVQPDQSPVFFGPEQEIVSDQSARSEVIPQTVKSRILKNPGGYGGGNATEPAERDMLTLIDTEVTSLLDDEDVRDPDAVAQLQDKPLEELHALSRYLDKQTNVRCRPDLFVWLARQDFGAKLLAGRKCRKDQGCKRSGDLSSLGADDRRKYLLTEQQREPVHPDLADVWHRALNHLSPALSKDAYETWIEPITLVVLEEGLAVVGTPNIFVRQEVEQSYKAHLEAALSQACERPIVLQAVIG
ncbi:MAG: helix-turn-helix domain-containing protein [Chloroflexota bacterium]|nr:helix-turn-helix domain-containing protein [Chloroflexota bacterium]